MLKSNQIDFTEVDDLNVLESKGFMQVPMVEFVQNFDETVQWIKFIKQQKAGNE